MPKFNQLWFWQQLADSTQLWKVKLVAWNHMERIEKTPVSSRSQG